MASKKAIVELKKAMRGIDHSLADEADYERFDTALNAVEADALSDFAAWIKVRRRHVTLHQIEDEIASRIRTLRGKTTTTKSN